MCQSRNSKKIHINEKETRYVDRCLANLLCFINGNTSFRTQGSCCGHGKYPMTIVCKSPFGFNVDICSGKIIPRKRRFYRKDSEGFYYIPEVDKLQYNKIEQISISDMYSLDWKQILYKAVQSRPTSWRVENPVTEYRNASDCIAQQVIHEMKNKDLIKEK